MNTSTFRWTCLVLIQLATVLNGCSWRPTANQHHLADSTFGIRHTGHYPPNSTLALAAEVTQIEDEIRRNGSITVKAPDVWGDANLMNSIQEYETEMKGTLGDFEEVLSAYLARSDQAELQSATGLAAGVAGGFNANGGAMPLTQAQVTQLVLPSVGEGQGSNIANTPPSQLLNDFVTAVPARAKGGVGVEPTELLRQHSTYIGVNQALRRRNMGDDRSRQAGYGLYKFRVPVSVLPGRQTNEGYAAVVNIRARMHIDAAHLKYTFSKLVVADVVDNTADEIFSKWENFKATPKEKVIDVARKSLPMGMLMPEAQVSEAAEAVLQAMGADQASGNELETASEQMADALFSEQDSPAKSEFRGKFQQRLQAEESAQGPLEMAIGPPLIPTVESFSLPVTPVDPSHDLEKTYGISVDALGKFVYAAFDGQRPKRAEIRQFLFDVLAQRYEIIRRSGRLLATSPVPNSPLIIVEAADLLSRGCDIEMQRRYWIEDNIQCGGDRAEIDWILALQAGVLDHNIKRMVEELRLQGKISEADAQIAACIHFFADPISDQDESVRIWDTIIQEAFPVHVFALDPQVEEQNAYDAFNRRREMQIALALSVAGGGFNTAQKVDMSRQLALDMAAIDLNRTAVAFSHDNDTFGWYFYPRIQSPPTEKSNIAALARLLWSNGPTQHYDRKHLQIEPGMRECEVLIAMPSFVPQVEFDVTTNWERLTNPGATKSSYEEMVALGGRVHRLRCNLSGANDEQCFRPGDYGRLISRVDQLEKMLSLQTYEVGLPFEYEQSGVDLFDRGNMQLRPELHDFYGLQYVTTDKDEGDSTHFFLRGKNFHPTQTHVIVGGAKSDSYSPSTEPDVQVISRTLIRVKVNRLFAKLSDDDSFIVRCGTPAGLSNPLPISGKKEPKSEPPKKEFQLDDPSLLTGAAVFNHAITNPTIGKVSVTFPHTSQTPGDLRINYGKEYPLPIGGQYQIITEWSFNTAVASQPILTAPISAVHVSGNVIQTNLQTVRDEIARAMQDAPLGRDYTEATGKVLLRIGDWPFINVGGDFSLKFFHEPPLASAVPNVP